VSEPRSIKDPNAPKKPLTSYMCFCKDKRLEIKVSNPGLKLPQISKMLGAAWKSLSEAEKGLYIQKALLDKERYSNDMKTYERPSDTELLEEKKSSRKRTISAVSGVKRPISSYMFFSKDKIREIKEANPEFTFKQINSELGRMWREVFTTPEDREKWVKLAETDRIRYHREKAEFLTSKGEEISIGEDLVVDIQNKKVVLVNVRNVSSEDEIADYLMDDREEDGAL
jgi:hypothetical protein